MRVPRPDRTLTPGGRARARRLAQQDEVVRRLRAGGRRLEAATVVVLSADGAPPSGSDARRVGAGPDGADRPGADRPGADRPGAEELGADRYGEALESVLRQPVCGLLVVCVATEVGAERGDWLADRYHGAARVVQLALPPCIDDANARRNVALRLTASRHVAFLDTGACWTPHHLPLAARAFGRGAEVSVAAVGRGPAAVGPAHAVLEAAQGAMATAPGGAVLRPTALRNGAVPDLAAVVARRVRGLRFPPTGPAGTVAGERYLARRLAHRLHVVQHDEITVWRSR